MAIGKKRLASVEMMDDCWDGWIFVWGMMRSGWEERLPHALMRTLEKSRAASARMTTQSERAGVISRGFNAWVNFKFIGARKTLGIEHWIVFHHDKPSSTVGIVEFRLVDKIFQHIK